MLQFTLSTRYFSKKALKNTRNGAGIGLGLIFWFIMLSLFNQDENREASNFLDYLINNFLNILIYFVYQGAILGFCCTIPNSEERIKNIYYSIALIIIAIVLSTSFLFIEQKLFGSIQGKRLGFKTIISSGIILPGVIVGIRQIRRWSVERVNKYFQDYETNVIYDPSLIVNEGQEAYSLYQEGSYSARSNEYEEAIKYFNRAISIRPYFSKAYLERGNAFANLKKYDLAFSDFSKAVEVNPNNINKTYFNNADSYLNSGNLYIKLQKYNEALNDYTKAISVDPNFSKAYYERGKAFAELQKYDKAIEDFKNIIDKNPNNREKESFNNSDLYFIIGNIYYELQKYDEAINYYTKAISVNINYSEAKDEFYYNRGNAYNEIQNYIKAIKDWEKAIELNPDNDVILRPIINEVKKYVNLKHM